MEKLGIVQHLVTLFDCSNSEVLQFKICRVISNQASEETSCSDFHKTGIVDMLLKYLNNTSEEESISAAIRAIRSVQIYLIVYFLFSNIIYFIFEL